MLQQVKEPQENMYKDTVQESPEGEGILQLKHTKEEVLVKTFKLHQIKEEEEQIIAEGTWWEKEVQGKWDMDLHSHGELLGLIWSLLLEVEPTVLQGLQFQVIEFKAKYITL